MGGQGDRRVDGALRARWHRASFGRRLVVAATALVVATAAVIGLGLATQPGYPVGGASGGPIDGLVVDELRHRPTPGPWRLTTAALGLPEVSDGCLTYSVLASVGADVLVSTSSQLAYTETGCYDERGRSERLVRLDPLAGTVRWSVDVSEISGGGGTLAAFVDEARGDAIVSTTGLYGYGRGASGYARVDLATGALADVTTSDDATPIVEAADDGLVLVSVSPAPVYGYSDDPLAGAAAEALLGSQSGPRTLLYRRDDLGTPVWSDEQNGDISSSVLLDDGLLVVSGGTGTVIDGATGDERSWADDLSPSAQAYGVGDTVFVVDFGRGMDSRAEVSAWSPDGTERWRRPFDQDRLPVVTGGCVAFSDRTGVHCADLETGDDRWVVERTGESRGIPLVSDSRPGRWDDDVFVQTFSARSGRGAGGSGLGDPAGDRALLLLDAETGSERMRAYVPPDSSVVAVSRSVAYVAGSDSSDAIAGHRVFSTVMGVDLAGGRTLWRLDSDADLQFWGGALVEIGDDGSIRRLIDDVRVTDTVAR
ncbi:PQQ-like beta-propeller repeat protein [Frigoribacterium faeni]|uniref:outer membrane protein assembly factor BamB family protein n=1 Tax=Frigoribacterium faeni TaxID=145483 RepID=UPI001FABB6A0|nr:PQQ-binding-like beta-propeller repeat protein [Frigoribacterium faeni]MCJ0701543.1 PQQ-like beta-propeller repeat protein [Frigoribacterium faeni]